MQHLKSVQIRPRKLALAASCCALTSSDVPPPQACPLGPDFALQARAELVSPACAGGRLCALRAPPLRTVGAHCLDGSCGGLSIFMRVLCCSLVCKQENTVFTFPTYTTLLRHT